MQFCCAVFWRLSGVDCVVGEGCVVVMVRMMGIVVELCCAWGGLGCGGRKRGVV